MNAPASIPTHHLNYDARDFFRALHYRNQRFAIIVAHRRAGKTVASINDLVPHVLSCPLPNPRGSYIAPTYAQAKDIAWNYIKETSMQIPGVKFRESDLTVKYPNGAQIKLYGAENADRIRGVYNDAVVMDEVADMRPEVWTEIVRPTLADRGGWAVFIGTPKGRDLFYEIWRMAQKLDDWFTLSLPVTATDALSPEEIANARATLPPNAFEREFMCRFDVGSGDQLISIADCNTAVNRDNSAQRGQGPITLGVDVARKGADRTVILARDGVTSPIYEVFHEDDLMRTAARVIQFERNLLITKGLAVQRTFVDAAGVGGGVVDRLQQLGMAHAIDVNGGRNPRDTKTFANLKSEMWWKMRDWIRDRGQLPDDRELIDDLTGVEYEFNTKDQIVLETKRDLKSRGLPSPDIADALALTFAEPVLTADSIANNRGTFAQAPIASGYGYWDEEDSGLLYH